MYKTKFALMVGLLGLLSTTVSITAAETSSTSTGEWGSLKGRFIVDGTPPKPAPLVVNKDAFCIQKKPINDSVVIGKGNSLVNAIVYLKLPLGKTVAINPEYEAQLKKNVELDNNGCSFHPHITLARVGQQLVVKNSDPVGHNTNVSIFGFNPIVPANSKVDIAVSKESPYPSPVNCNIHSWMLAYILPLSHPYAAVSGADGTFEIKDLPAGPNEFQFWHEVQGNLKNLKFKGGSTDPKGRAKITIEPGKTLDLGDIKVSAAVLVAK